MATLVLGAVGTLVGGPVGGAIGALLGQSLDQRLFAPKRRHGPRLGELSVQTSAYGSAIPKLFGTMRVAGTVVWATDLQEHRATSGGGKGRPKSVSYAYSASFAVALSARPVLSVGRIWADGKLLRGAAGDFKSACAAFRLHRGGEDQAVDPLLAAVEGAGHAPAYRGTAYAVFEDLALEDFGNRIPSLTFEVTADAEAVTIGAIAEALGEGAVEAGATPALAGYAASGDSVRGALEALGEVVPLSLTDDGVMLRLTATGGEPVSIEAHEESGKRELVRLGAGQVPAEVSIAYYEIERDWQTGLQRAARGEGARTVERLALPAALSAGAAKALAEHRLGAFWAGRSTAKIALGWRRADLRPGARVMLAGASGVWRITRWTLGPMAVTLELTRAGGTPPAIQASPGRPTSQPDRPHGATILRLHDLPIGDGLGTRPGIAVLAGGEEAGWRRAALSASFDGGVSWQGSGATAAPAVLGVAVTSLARAGSALLDQANSVEVVLAGDGWLEGRDDPALAAGANLALLGGELIQFGAAEPLGGGRFRLSRLLRGRRGTEWAAALHEADETFALLEPDAVATIEAPALGGEVRVLANGVGDDPDGVAASIVVTGEALRPPSPVHLRAETTGTGDTAIGWTRRSRQGWAWTDGTDAPLGEEIEAYRVTITGAGFARTIETAAPICLYTAAQQAADGAVSPLHVSVVQTGTLVPSRPALLTID